MFNRIVFSKLGDVFIMLQLIVPSTFIELTYINLLNEELS